jgi:hypothetical protein
MKERLEKQHPYLRKSPRQILEEIQKTGTKDSSN